MDEVSVYASRYAIDGGLAEPRELSPTDIERVPGSHDDALRALHSLPGIASNASGRPYIRGSLSEDVLVRYDGIPLLDPFHLKNFQSLISAIDPAGIERIEVFSGGFPVRYGTRSGGVIDITAPTYASGREYRASASLISAGVSSIGKAERWPLEWLGAIRHSTLDMIDPVEDGFGKPEFSDTLGRVRWATENGAWTAGWLLLDDRLELGSGGRRGNGARPLSRRIRLAGARSQVRRIAANSRQSRDHLGGARPRRHVDAAGRGATARSMRCATSMASISRTTGRLSAAKRPPTPSGWGSRRRARPIATLRHSEFAPDIAATFGRGLVEDLQLIVNPEVVTYSAVCREPPQVGPLRSGARRSPRRPALRRRGRRQSHADQPAPEPAVRLRAAVAAVRIDRTFLPGATRRGMARRGSAAVAGRSAGVHPHDRRVSSTTPRRAARLGLEAYSKRWTTVSAYFDNQLDPLALLPDLAPDRLRVRPHRSEATGLEFSVRKPISDSLTGWGTLAWSRVADDFRGGGDVLRSWDQPLAVNAGLAWKGSRASLSALAGWHRGWPKTRFDLTPQLPGAAQRGALGRLLHARSSRQLDLGVRDGRSVPGARRDQRHSAAQRMLPRAGTGRRRARGGSGALVARHLQSRDHLPPTGLTPG